MACALNPDTIIKWVIIIGSRLVFEQRGGRTKLCVSLHLIFIVCALLYDYIIANMTAMTTDYMGESIIISKLFALPWSNYPI